MALRQTKKISELPALSPASLDTTFVVGISGSTTYKISINNLTSSLDTTFATDLVTNALSSSLDTKLSTSSFNSYTASISTGSLVTSISNLNIFTASVTTASIVTSISNLNTFTASVSTASLVISISNLNTFTASQSTSSLVNRLNAIESVSGSWITESETGSFLTSLSGAISGSSQLTSSFDQRYVISGSITQTTWDNIASKPGGIVSSSIQISDLGFVTGSYTTINSFNSLTQSFNSISQSFNVISGSVVSIQGGFDTGSYQTFTSSVNTSISNLNTFTASISTGSLVTSISNLNTFTASQSTSSLVNRLNAIESVSGSWITESETGSFLTSLSGAISSSSQLTSSYDTRYTLSGSISAVPSGTISGSSQLTSSFDTRYSLSGSSNINTSSFATTGSNSFNGSQTITGSLVVSQNITGSASASFISLAVNTTTPTQKIHLKGAVGIENGTTGGNTADQFVFGYVGSNLTQYTHKIQTGHDAQAALNRMDFQIANSSNTWKTPLQLRPDVINVSGSLIVTGSINGTINSTNGVVSGSSQILGGSGIFSSSAQLPTGTTSGSSQLTSSYDGRYIQTGSFNTYTSSFSSSLASSITSVSGTFTNLTVNGQPTIYGVVSPDYISVGNNGEPQNVAASGTDIIFDTNIASSGIGYNTGTGVFTLTAGKTYKIQSEIGFEQYNGNGYLLVQLVDATTNTAINTQVNTYPYNTGFNEVNNLVSDIIYTPSTNQTVKFRVVGGTGGLTAKQRGAGFSRASIVQINPSVALNGLNTMQISGSLTTTGSITSLGGITGSIAATNGVISGSTQLTTAFPSKTTGAWSAPAGASTQSFTVEAGASYTMWVNGNIPNGIITWNATVTTSNTNVPVVGSQYGWYYTPGNALVLTTIPDQIIGTNGSIANTPTSYAPNTSNVFKFGITNNSGTTQTINYGYIKLS